MSSYSHNNVELLVKQITQELFYLTFFKIPKVITLKNYYYNKKFYILKLIIIIWNLSWIIPVE